MSDSLDIHPAVSSDPSSINGGFSQAKIRTLDAKGGPMILRITERCSQGDQDHMEDKIAFACVSKGPSSNGNRNDIMFAGVFDGHHGVSCAEYVKQHLMKCIMDEPGFFSKNDARVLQAIKRGFLKLQERMEGERENWPRHDGFPSASGTTASVAFIKNGRLFTGHVGDSRIVVGVGYQDRSTSPGETPWLTRQVTKDHKPEDENEGARIRAAGGKVMPSGTEKKVVWTKQLHRKRSTRFVDIPFLSVSRSLGAFWSQNAVSAEPDVNVIKLDPRLHRCIIIASGSVWSNVTSEMAVDFVQEVELYRKENLMEEEEDDENINSAYQLVEYALHKCRQNALRAENASAIIITLECPEIEVINLDSEDDTDSHQSAQESMQITPPPPLVDTLTAKRTYPGAGYPEVPRKSTGVNDKSVKRISSGMEKKNMVKAAQTKVTFETPIRSSM